MSKARKEIPTTKKEEQMKTIYQPVCDCTVGDCYESLNHANDALLKMVITHWLNDEEGITKNGAYQYPSCEILVLKLRK